MPLARAEVESLVYVIDDSASVQWDNRLGIIGCNEKLIPFLVKRAVLLREAGRILASSDDIDSLVNNLDCADFLGENQSAMRFAVKVQDIDSTLQSGDKEQLASAIGKRILGMTGWSVSLKYPDIVFTLFISEGSVHLCESFSSRLYKHLEQIGRNNRAFFHPSMMNAVLARVMNNIAGVMPFHTLLDPFCGGGGILSEASKIGLKVIGIDTSWRLLDGARRNLQLLSWSNFCLLQGDSRSLPVRDIDYVVTDPPYGRTSSTQGTETIELVCKFVRHLTDWNTSPVLCICGDDRMEIGSIFSEVGGHIQYRISIPVHASLTREILRVVF